MSLIPLIVDSFQYGRSFYPLHFGFASLRGGFFCCCGGRRAPLHSYAPSAAHLQRGGAASAGGILHCAGAERRMHGCWEAHHGHGTLQRRLPTPALPIIAEAPSGALQGAVWRPVLEL